MSIPSPLATIDTTVQELRIETQLSGFTHKLAHVVTAFGAVPDLPQGALTAEEMARLRELAEETVNAVERRIEAAADDEETQQHLAGTVYEIRRRMEAAETWYRHLTR